jgi:hypothetical protein
MAHSSQRWSSERITGFVMIAIFAAGIIGATVAIVMNHGTVPHQIVEQTIDKVKDAAPL